MASSLHISLVLASLVAVFASKDAATPIQKVLDLLAEMREKGLADKQAEEAEFAAYQTFFETSFSEKTGSIASRAQDAEILKADIQQATTSAEMAGKKVDELNGDIQGFTASITGAQSARDTERASYDTIHADYTELIDAIVKAIDVLKTQADKKKAPPTGAVSLLSQMENAKVAEAQKLMAIFLSNYFSDRDVFNLGQEPAAEEKVTFDSIISMLEKLRDRFMDERSAKEKEELTKSQAFATQIEDLKKSIEDANKQISDKKTEKAAFEQTEAQKTAALKDLENGVAADQTYLSDLNATYAVKSADSKQRSSIRDAELAAIDKAIAVLSGGKTAIEKQQAKTAAPAATSLAFLRAKGVGPVQMQVAEFLRDKAAKLDSRLLSAIAMKAAVDPFIKVRQLIAAYIDHLRTEKAQEADHESWCNKEVETNTETRNARSIDVAKLTSEIDQKTAAIALLAAEIADYETELTTNAKAATDSASLREQEKAANAKAVEDSKEAQKAISEALTILKEFYQGTTPALVQVGEKQAPEEYKGMTKEGNTVISLLEEILSDIAREEAAAAASETAAQAAYVRLTEELEASKTQIQANAEHKSREKTLAEQALANLQTDLGSAQKELDAAEKYYKELQTQCLEGGSAEERKLRREEEIQALEEASRLLEGYDVSDATNALMAPHNQKADEAAASITAGP